jgi:hypothetical protein
MKKIVILGISAVLMACGGSGNEAGPGQQEVSTPRQSSVVASAQIEAPSAYCSNGGIAVDAGIDSNGNGLLDAGEVSNTQYVCNGAPGANGTNALVSMTAEPAGANCATGGKAVNVGKDVNSDGMLGASEVTSSGYICFAANGTNGANSIAATVAEAAGANCPNGGLKTTSGMDANANNVLDVAEVKSTAFVCNGANGSNGSAGANGLNGAAGANGLNSLTATVTEPAGTNCSNGGLRTTAGLDANANSVLDVAEVTSTAFVCNGANGANGANGERSKRLQFAYGDCC